MCRRRPAVRGSQECCVNGHSSKDRGWKIEDRVIHSILDPRSSILDPRSSNFLRHFERLTVLAPQHVIGLTVLDDLLFRGVEFDRTLDSI